MEKQKGQVKNLLEDGWFFGNTLLSTSKMVRCNSDPSPSSMTIMEDEALFSKHHRPSSNNLHRTPSLPPCFNKDMKYEPDVVRVEAKVEEEEDDEPRMGDLIRQAMPPMPMSMPCRRLDRAPSLPPCRGKHGLSSISNINNNQHTRSNEDDESSSNLLHEENLLLRQEKNPIGMSKLSRRASIDSSVLLPPKYTSKGKKNRSQRKQDPHNINGPSKTEQRGQNLDKTKSQKSPTDLEIQELQGFKDLGFSFDAKKVNPNMAHVLPALQRTQSIDSHLNKHGNKIRRPYLSEAWENPSVSSPVEGSDKKSPSSEDMKAHIKFWARAVASNVRQEC